MDNQVVKYLNDILLAIENIDVHLQGRRIFSEFAKNLTSRRAVEREIGIIGEAVSKIIGLDPQIKISSSRKIVTTRNIVVHAYDAVDEIVIWEIIMKHIPVLKAEVENLLSSKS